MSHGPIKLALEESNFKRNLLVQGAPSQGLLQFDNVTLKYLSHVSFILPAYLAVAHSDLAGPVYGMLLDISFALASTNTHHWIGNDYTYRDSFDLVSTNLAPCGTSTILNMNSDVRVNNAANRQGSGYLATDSVDAKLSTVSCFHSIS